ncbi:AfsR/SARP family transcriptional regulator [Kribbella flavida]|uniref:AfsR/SARP family transcriptional regulator n=1 Tax=Kribbella flavida TaxID=182640 RepID=UPI00019BE5D2|nr:BTAD domain-containing putative transcriptional regulator [Kribbella flavida]
MWIRLLGSFEVRRQRHVLEVPAGRQRSVLAALAVSGPRMVPVDVLIDLTWGESLPGNAKSALHNNVRRLRKLLGQDTIRTVPGGYQLEPGAAEVDVTRFVRLTEEAAQAAPGAAAKLLDEALQLWAGEPFTGVPSGPLQDEHLPALTERHLAAIEQRIDLAEDSAEWIPQLNELVSRYPLRESLWLRLLTALQRSGRQAEALSRYEELRLLVTDQLGTPPAAELQQLYHALLAPDPAPAPAAPPAGRPVPRQLPPAPVRCVGRPGDLAALDRMRARSARTIALHGPGGVGKTTLGLQWATRTASDYPDGQLYLDLRGYGPDEPLEPLAGLGMLLRSAGVPDRAVPATVAERTALLRTVLSDRRMLVFLDNARDSDHVRPLLPGGDCLTIVTSRNELLGLAVRDGASRHAVRLLSMAESVELLEATLGVPADRSALEELAELCGHLPLALTIAALQSSRHDSPVSTTVAALRAQQDRLDLLSDSHDSSTDLRTVLAWSYDALDRQEARAFALLGLHPTPDFELNLAAALIGEPRQRARRLMDRLAAVHLLQVVGRDHYRLHDLLAVFAAELAEREPERKDALTRLDDWYILTTAAARTALLRAVRDRDYQPRTALEPLEFEGLPDAFAWYRRRHGAVQRLVHAAAERGDHERVVALTAELCDLQTVDRDPDTVEWLAIAELGVQAADELGDPALRGWARFRRARGLFLSGDPTGAIAEQQKVCDLARLHGNARLLAAALTFLTAALGTIGQREEARQAATEAVELARASTERSMRLRLAHALINLGGTELDLVEPIADAIEHTTEALEIYRELESGYHAGRALANLSEMAMATGDAKQALAYTDAALAELAGLEDRLSQQPLSIHRGHVLVALGRRDEARAVWQQALEVFTAAGDDRRRAELTELIAGL